MKKFPVLSCALCVILFQAAYGSGQLQRGLLDLNSPIENEISAGQRHRYSLNLRPNQIAQVTVEQRGIDLVVVVLAPGGETLFEVDSPTGSQGNETVTVAATEQGSYLVEVRPLAEKAAPGSYQIRLDRYLTESEYQTERLAGLGRLWGAVKLFHPYLAYKNADWDGALVKAIPQVRSARTPEQYRQAINRMLQTLDDSTTTAEPASVETRGAGSQPGKETEPVFYRVTDGFVLVNAIDWSKAFMSGNWDAFAKQPQMLQEIAKARGVIIDCRFGELTASQLPVFFLQRYLNNILPLLVQGSPPLGTRRYRIHDGYPPQQGTSGGYTSTFVTESPGAIDGRAASKKPISVIIDDRGENLIALLAGLQGYGAKIVQAGTRGELSGASYYRMQLPDGLRVKIRTTEFVHPDGSSAFNVDAQLPEDTPDEKVISAAITALSAPAVRKTPAQAAATTALVMQSLRDDPYAAMSFPREEYRLLGLFRFWNVIAYMFPYKHLIDKPWEKVLTDFIPRFLDNKTLLDYEMTVAEMVARIQDTHGFVRGYKALWQHLGTHAPPIHLRAVGGKLVVVSILDQAQAPGVNVGDVIVAVDGQPVDDRIAYLSKFMPLSTVQSAYSYIYPAALRGAANSKALLRIESADGKIRELELTRSADLDALEPASRTTPKVYEVLPSGYGYIDLARLPLADAQKALDAMMHTPAIIFDMRGYPNGTAWELAPRLTEKKNVTGALFQRPYQSAANLTEQYFAGGGPNFSFAQTLPSAKGAIYKGKVVILIDYQAISQAEHTCMFFEAATDVTFIRTPTNGANGDVTNLSLPGGIYVNFSGHDVRHADGRQLQRVGIQPTIKVEPTVAGIREGRDEVLEAAIKFLNSAAKR